MNQLIAELDGFAEDLARDGATGVETVASASQQLERLERENTQLRNEIARLNSQTNWVCKCGGTDCAGQKENAALRAERDAARKLLDTHVLRSDLFGYLAWLEDHRDHGDIDLKSADYLILASDGTTCWGKTFMEAVQVAEQHDRKLFDANRKEAQP